MPTSQRHVVKCWLKLLNCQEVHVGWKKPAICFVAVKQDGWIFCRHEDVELGAVFQIPLRQLLPQR